jgi:ribose/xylose/arabinose/galactoside ABC-type transport system permease subunit
MNSAKKIILPGVFTALLIGGQLALSGISGIEVVTVLLLTFVYKYGIGQGLLVANSFSLLRCFIFGFIPNVIVLYLIYYIIISLSLCLVFWEKYLDTNIV